MCEGQDLMPGGKRDDPNYSQVSGYIPKELALEFRIACTSSEVTQSDALEEAIKLWLATKAAKDKRVSNRG